MPRRVGERDMDRGLRPAGADRTKAEVQRVLRCSQIFSSAVRDVLQLQPLRGARPKSLTLSQFHLLKLTSLDAQPHVGEVADFLGFSAPAATKNIDKLERLGLLSRIPAPADRRTTLLAASAKGRRFVRRLERHNEDCLQEALDAFSTEEAEQFASLLERFSLRLLELLGEERGFCLRCGVHLESDCPIGREHGGCPYEVRRNQSGPSTTKDES